MTITHCTHDEYLDTPTAVIERTLRIHRVYEDVKNKQAQSSGVPNIS